MKVEAVLTLATRDRFTLAECEELAKDTDTFNSMTFDLVGPKGRKSCKWVDAYFGIFELDGKAFQSAQFKYAHDLYCESLSASVDTHPEGGDAQQGSVHG